MNYTKLLEDSFVTEQELNLFPADTRLEYLSQHIFDFTTYDPEMDELFARKAVEVCQAISNGTTFHYIGNAENYQWYLVMCNMPFFSERMSWGTSIRGAWWDLGPESTTKLKSCGLWSDEPRQIMSVTFSSVEDWKQFVQAVIDFAAPDMNGAAASD